MIDPELLERLKKIQAEINPEPWCEGYMYGAIRHIERNVDVDAFHIGGDGHLDDCAGGPGRYDGTSLAVLRNNLPAIIRALSAAQEYAETMHKPAAFAWGEVERRLNDFLAEFPMKAGTGETG